MHTVASTRADPPAASASASSPDLPAAAPESFWGSLRQLNAFRLFLAVFFVALAMFAEELRLIGPRHWRAFLGVCALYGLITLLFAFVLRARQPNFDRQLTVHLLADIALLTTLMHLAGGNATGLGLLLMVPLAAAGMHPRARVRLLLPALAALAVLLEQSLQAWWHAGEVGAGYTRAAMLSAGFFAVVGLSHVLARELLSTTRLVGEQAQTMASLEKINAQIIQDLPYGLIVVDGSGCVMQSNHRAEILLACTGQPRTELEQCAPSLAQLWQDWQAQGDRAWRILDPLEGRRLRARVLGLDPQRRQGAAIVVEDMSELEEEAMRMKLAALGRLTANLAHEIRNPLSAIQHAAALLREDARDPESARLMRIIEDNVARLNWLVEDVLSLSRRDRQNREHIDLPAFLAEFVAQFQRNEGIPEGVIRIDIAADVDKIEFDRMHLHQVLWNLCRNARRYASLAPGSIVLAARREGEHTLVDVQNDGPAIPPKLQSRLFDPFYTTEKSGTGLGLYIARELAEANGGKLRCLPQTQGASFRLYCPSAPI